MRTDVLETSEDAVLGGRLRLRQPLTGHRVGHDAILLAAVTGGHAGEHVIDFGAGVGAAGLALAVRVAGLKVTLVEIDPALCALAEGNARLNNLADQVSVLAADSEDADALAAAGIGGADRVLMNPPFHDASRQNSVARPAQTPRACGGARTVTALGRECRATAQAARRADADLARRCTGRGATRADG